MWRKSFDVPLSHYEEASGGFSAEKERLQRRNINDRIRTLSKHISLDNTCDVGGSKGYFIEALLKKGYSGVYGIDPNKTQVEVAQERGLPMLVGSTADLSNIFPKRKTKNASLFHVIEHLTDPASVMRELYAALPVGGYLIVETPDFTSFAFKRANYIHKLVYKEHLFYFSTANLKRFIEKFGFIVEKIYMRDFDQYHLNARESLFRLGLMRREGPLTVRERILYRTAILFTVPLSLLVKIYRRNMFTLVVARKPESATGTASD
jgi:2-polyprenyl-3-methyl-5-hydroxy-6-metoxy-1,4-benzoquinol methylase